MEKMGVIDRAILSEGQTWATAERDRNNAEDVPVAGMVLSFR